MLSRTPLGLASPPFPITWRRLRVFQNNANTRARFAPETSGTKGDPEALAKLLGAAVDRVNADLSVIEKVRRFIVADEPFTVDNEEMTPSMKIRRHVISKRYAPRLDALFKR